MSRTIRRKDLNWREEELPKATYDIDYENDVAYCHYLIVHGLEDPTSWLPPSKIKQRFHGDKWHYRYSGFPRLYRNIVNRQRRSRDRRELHKELTLENYEGLYSNWNHKDSDPWWW